MCSLSECLEVSFKQCLFNGLTPSLVVVVLARDEARKNTFQPSVKPPDKYAKKTGTKKRPAIAGRFHWRCNQKSALTDITKLRGSP
jgi:hypothetical protein